MSAMRGVMLAAVVAALCAVASAQCTRQVPDPAMTTCAWYNGDSCCDATQADTIALALAPEIAELTNQTCIDFLSAFFCSECSPSANAFDIDSATAKPVMCEEFCDKFWDTCQDESAPRFASRAALCGATATTRCFDGASVVSQIEECAPLDCETCTSNATEATCNWCVATSDAALGSDNDGLLEGGCSHANMRCEARFAARTCGSTSVLDGDAGIKLGVGLGAGALAIIGINVGACIFISRWRKRTGTDDMMALAAMGIAGDSDEEIAATGAGSTGAGTGVPAAGVAAALSGREDNDDATSSTASATSSTSDTGDVSSESS